MRDAIILDMDGTLCDVRSIRHHVMGAKRNFHAFHTESVNCPANDEVVLAAKQAHVDGLAILVVTARSFEFAFHTMFWLSGQDVHYDELYMRRSRDYRPDYVVKKEILHMIQKDGYNVVHAWDDNPNVIEVWREAGIPVTIVEGFGFDE